MADSSSGQRRLLSMNKPQTLSQAMVYFSDPDRAFEYAKELRWPDGKVTCPRCESPKNSFIKTRKACLCIRLPYV